MTRQRKRIAVFMAECEHPVQQRVLRGIIKQAYALDCDVAIFSPLLNFNTDSPHQRCEQNIFRLMNPAQVDGVIYARRLLRCGDDFRAELDKRLRDAGLPVVALNGPDDVFPYVVQNDRAAFAELTEHFITQHGCRNMLCLTGPQGIYESEERARGFQDALARHGLPFSPEMVVYGDFWTEAAERLGAALVSGERPPVEAVICANDPMAVTLCNYLTDHGVAVPDDIAVAGYEASDDSRENLLPVTSYFSDAYGMGREAMCRLYEKITGEAQPVAREGGHLVTRQSCGCGEAPEMLVYELRRMQRERKYRALLHYSDMAVQLTMTETLDDCIAKVGETSYLIRGAREYYLCLCEDWAGSYDLEHPERYRRVGYSEMMRVKLVQGEDAMPLWECRFPVEEMLPALFALRDKPRAYYFTPLHHNDRVFGYSALSFGDAPDCYSDVFCQWSANVSNALEFIRMQNYLKTFHNQLYLSSIRDSLTGLYNRAGFMRALEECTGWAVESGKPLLVLAANLDNLAKINDSQGHQEGDNAIIRFANAIMSSFSGSERCARVRGDGFAVVGCGDYDAEAAVRYSNAVIGYLEHSGEVQGGCRLEASIGVFCDTVTAGTSPRSLYALAEERMNAHRESWNNEQSIPYYKEFTALRSRIYDTPKGDWSIDAVCRELILSRGYFQKLYTRCFGISFTQDVINSRIYFSKRLLTQTDQSIAAIAAQSGYDNYVHFMHQFKKIVGMTPTDYRKRKRNV